MELGGTYTRKCDGVACTYRVECNGGSECGDVVWDVRVYVGDRFVGKSGGAILASNLSSEELKQAIQEAAEWSIEGSVGIRI